MKLDSVSFNYEYGTDYGNALLTIIDNNNEYHGFDFEFTAFQDRDCSYSCHSSTQEQPDEDYFEYDVIDKIVDFDDLIHRIKAVFNKDVSEDELEEFIRDEFYKIRKERYLYTREG